MTTLGRELRIIHNPALGAVILWRFATRYEMASPTKAQAPLPLISLVLPIIWHAETLSYIRSTREASGLRAFADKFADQKPFRLDTLLDLHSRTSRWRTKTLEALQIGISTGLMTISSTGRVGAAALDFPLKKQPDETRTQVAASEKLAVWFASLEISEIALILKLRF